ncbi:PAS domain S-box protein [Methanoplanus sp. FWC-SCC4]|uniref:PAS domain S-box protein n=1 Tax=Methanochimaera problematica TaxID=2609417 RepID=A0AA97FDS9_9EURY|nr:PAS domain S-box protein [Methanoplanus sp. FWC-SCC4]WOF17007.1 PAS domain S-box protein [Methanoplanus sp. FWC-SCC4]
MVSVLIVEDEAVIGLNLKRIVEKMGYQPLEVAVDAHEAVDVALEKKPDIILMDINLGGDMDGIDASEEINRQMSVPVVFLSAYNDENLIRRCVNSGSYGFLAKPASPPEIKAAIEIALSKHEAIRARNDIEKKESILQAVGFAANQFLSNPFFEDSLEKTLEFIGNATKFDKISIFQNNEGGDGNKRSAFISHVWRKDGNKEGTVDACSFEIDYECISEKFYQNLSSGLTFLGGSGDYLREKSGLFENPEFCSFVAIPVFAGEYWWGFISFEDCHNNREWSSGEIEGLGAAAKMIGSALLHKRMCNNIIKNEEKYRSLFNLLTDMCDNVPDMIWSKDLNNCFTFANRALSEVILNAEYGKEPIGKNTRFFAERERKRHPEDPMWYTLDNSINKTDDLILKSGNSCNFIQKGYLKGKYTVLDVFKAPFYDNSGNLMGTVGCARDVTKEKAIEANLRELNIRFTTFMDQLPAFAYIADTSGTIIYSNRFMDENITAFEGTGDEMSHLIRERVRKVTEGGAFEEEESYKLSDGTLHTFNLLMFPISAQGHVTAIGVIGVDVTAGRLAEKKRLESESKYRLLFENASDSIYVSEGDRCIDCNPRLCELLGLEKSAILGKNVLDFSPEYQPDGRLSSEKKAELLSYAKEGKRVENFEWQIINSKGGSLDVEISMNSAYIDNKLNYFVIARDITEEKRSKEALLESEKRYRSVVDNAPIGIEVFQDGMICYASPNVSKMFGLSGDEILTMSLDELLHPDDARVVSEINKKRLLLERVPDSYNVRVNPLLSKGRIIEVHVALIDWNNRPATLNFLTDITEKEKAAMALKESEERYRSVVENSKGIILITQDEKILYANPVSEQFTGLSENEIKGRNFIDFIYEEDREKVLSYHKQRLLDGNTVLPYDYKVRAYDHSGAVRTLDFSTTVIHWKGKPATLNFLLDITDQIEAKKQLERSLKEKTVLLQEVHHRVKNNLAMINSLLSMQERSAENKDVINSLREAESRIFSIAVVHEGLYKSDSISTISAQNHFAMLAGEIVSNYNPKGEISLDVNAGECGLGLSIAIPVSLVVNELLTNSIKYAFEGRYKGKISIYMDCRGERTRMVISDDGVGIPKDFDIHKSSSLGMSLVRNIVEMQLEGDISLIRGEGTKWVITYPHHRNSKKLIN